MQEAAGGNEPTATDTDKAQAQEKKWPPKKVVGAGEQLLDPTKYLRKMPDDLWRGLNYVKKKSHLLSGLPGFLRKHLSPEKRCEMCCIYCLDNQYQIFCAHYNQGT